MDSFWIDSTKEKNNNFKTLNEDMEVDVCIIGGGLVGLQSAYYLSKAGLKIAVLERGDICSHTSGHSTAKITSQHDLFYKYLIDSFGKDYARDYLLANEEAVANIKHIIEKEKIDCDFSMQDAYVYTQSEDDIQKIKDEVDSVKSMGFECEYVEKIPIPIKILGAIKFPNQAEFHPRKYAFGLCDVIQSYSGDIYTNTKVVSSKKENDFYITTTENEHSIKSKYVILATHYPIINFPGLYYLKMYQSTSYIIAVDTKTDLNDGMYINSETPTYSFRTTPYEDKKILLVAGSDHKTGAKIDLSEAYDNLEKKAKELYPKAEVLYRWCTEDCISLDKIPYIGEFSTTTENMFIATGFKKWGISSSNVAANILTDKILGRENKYEYVFRSTRFEPVKNHEELGNMLKEVTHSLVLNKLRVPKDKFEDIEEGEGKIIEIDGDKVGVYKDENGEVFAVKPVCSHLGCEVSFNNLEKTWDCPCHGSRYTYKGEYLYEPTVNGLGRYEFE
jgi:glycine/D-amino acid oxidase-like deaminating enzyme/nitrite reductase/ring-hydroxylating ferredoxin subunit